MGKAENTRYGFQLYTDFEGGGARKNNSTMIAGLSYSNKMGQAAAKEVGWFGPDTAALMQKLEETERLPQVFRNVLGSILSKAEARLKNYILLQKGDWPEYGRRYRRWKAKNYPGMENLMLMATKQYLDSIKIYKAHWSYDNFDYYLQCMPEIYQRLAYSLELGGLKPAGIKDKYPVTKEIQARPHWGPTFEEASKEFRNQFKGVARSYAKRFGKVSEKAKEKYNMGMI